MQREGTFTLFCWIFGGAFTSIFSVQPPQDARVEHLRELIKDKNQNSFRDVDADNLRLWMLRSPIPREELIEKMALIQLNTTSCVELNSLDDLSDHFSLSPPKHLHIVVQSSKLVPTNVSKVTAAAASGLHAALWNKPLNIFRNLLVNSLTFQYLPQSSIEELQLKRLGFRENVLLVREEYKSALDRMKSGFGLAKCGGGVAIIGQPRFQVLKLGL